jgi:hypothetical protein
MQGSDLGTQLSGGLQLSCEDLLDLLYSDSNPAEGALLCAVSFKTASEKVRSFTFASDAASWSITSASKSLNFLSSVPSRISPPSSPQLSQTRSQKCYLVILGFCLKILLSKNPLMNTALRAKAVASFISALQDESDHLSVRKIDGTSARTRQLFWSSMLSLRSASPSLPQYVAIVPTAVMGTVLVRGNPVKATVSSS